MQKRFDPSLISHLVTFEAAARSGSFTRAAEELAVSQPAVSHAMRSLESALGLSLFERRHKGVDLTPAGHYLLEQTSQGLARIDQALRELRNRTRGQQVTLAVSTATATWWLMPRIARFKQLHPDIELRCITTDVDLNLERERIDLAITLGSGEFLGHERWHFVDEEVFPVCSPAYLAQCPRLADPADLTRAALLHLEERYRPRLDWAGWLAHFGIALPLGSKRFAFNDYSIVLQAALEGQGVALGWGHIVAPLIQQGRLVAPMTQRVTTDQPMYILAPAGRVLRPAVSDLRDWLVAEARAGEVLADSGA